MVIFAVLALAILKLLGLITLSWWLVIFGPAVVAVLLLLAMAVTFMVVSLVIGGTLVSGGAVGYVLCLALGWLFGAKFAKRNVPRGRRR